MANYVIAPNMGFRDPTPGVETGPLYAQEIYNALLTIDSHDHTGGGTGGKQLTQAALNITGALSFAGQDATNLRTTRYQDQAAIPSGIGDVDAIFFHLNDLWIVNGAGNAVQITNGTQINVATANTVYGSISVAGNKTILATDTYVLLNVDTTAGRIITLPAANSVTAGRYYLVADASLLAATNAITINPAGADTINGLATYSNAMTGGVVLLISDGASKWHALAFVTGLASATSPGLLSPAFQALLAGATTAATASTLALRDGAGILTAASFVGTKLDAPSAGTLFIGTTNGTTIQAGQVGVGTVTNLRSETVNVTGSVGLAATSGTFSGTLGVTGLSSIAGLSLTGNITWGAAVAAPSIGQAQNASAAGNPMAFTAQRGAAGFIGGTYTTGGGPGGTSGTNLGGDARSNLQASVGGVSAKHSFFVDGASVLDVSQTAASVSTIKSSARLQLQGSSLNIADNSANPIISYNISDNQINLFKELHFNTASQPKILHNVAGGTGATVGLAMTIQAQQGQLQTGVNANNNGGALSVASGTAGTGGSGAAGVSGTLQLLAGANVRFSANDTGIGLYAAAPVAQAARPGQLADSTGGTPGTTLAAIAAGAAYAQADMVAVKNALASICAKYDALELASHNIGMVA